MPACTILQFQKVRRAPSRHRLAVPGASSPQDHPEKEVTMSDTSRRALLTALSVAPVALVPALPAIGGETENPDAQLLDLVRRCIEAMSRTNAFQAILDAAEDRYERAPMPEAMYVRAS